jgi:hypothetical protein
MPLVVKLIELRAFHFVAAPAEESLNQPSLRFEVRTLRKRAIARRRRP